MQPGFMVELKEAQRITKKLKKKRQRLRIKEA